MIYKGGIGIGQHWQAWLHLENPAVTLNQAIKRLQNKHFKETGNKLEILILDKDGTHPENPRPGVPSFKIMDVKSDESDNIEASHVEAKSNKKG